MVISIQTSIYNRIQAAKGAQNSYAAKHQPPRHSELVSESNQLHPQQSNLIVTKGLIALNQINSVSFAARPIETRKDYIYSRTPGLESKPIPVKVVREDLNGIIIHTVKDLEGEELGFIRVVRSEHDINSELEMPLYKRNQDSLVVSSLKSRRNEEYKGIGTVLMQSALQESKRQKLGGRITLYANNGRSPTPFYYKMGLRFRDEDLNEAMGYYLEDKANGKNPKLIKELESGIMYLPKENIEILENYDYSTKRAEKCFERAGHTTSFATIYPKNAEEPPVRTIIKKEKDDNGEYFNMYAAKKMMPVGYIRLGIPKENMDAYLGRELSGYFRNSLVVEVVTSKPNNQEYQGIGTALMKQAVYESMEKGHGGRLSLRAVYDWTGYCPTEFYYKLGFRFPDNKLNKTMGYYLARKSHDKKVRIPKNIMSGNMYLPKENIQALLNKEIIHD